jgi:hypothetical protein
MRVVIDPVDEALLLDVLNSAPVVQGAWADGLSAEDAGRSWLREHGLADTTTEWQNLSRTRELLWQVIRDGESPAVLDEVLGDVSFTPAATDTGVSWSLQAPAGHRAAARLVVAWNAVTTQLPGRLRPCANPDCRLFLVDHSKSNNARWCSMAVCGNRMKARRHHARNTAAKTD